MDIHTIQRKLNGATLVAVTKKQPVEKIHEAVEAGITHIGESYVEEAREKRFSVATGAENPIIWHMVGHVQSRKAAEVAELFDWVDSVDSVALAKKLSAAAGERGKTLTILLEVNLMGEQSKSGFDMAGWETDDTPKLEGSLQGTSKLAALLADIRMIGAMPHLVIAGLMVMPPKIEETKLRGDEVTKQGGEQNREVFASAKRLFEEIGKVIVSVHWKHLSMGTSQDYQVAIEEGATMVRLGTVLFGERKS